MKIFVTGHVASTDFASVKYVDTRKWSKKYLSDQQYAIIEFEIPDYLTKHN